MVDRGLPVPRLPDTVTDRAAKRITEMLKNPKAPKDFVKPIVERELALIAELRYEPFFLTVYEVVRFARERRILYLRFFLGKTQSEIARELGISQMHVSRLLSQTLTALRREAGEG